MQRLSRQTEEDINYLYLLPYRPYRIIHGGHGNQTTPDGVACLANAAPKACIIVSHDALEGCSNQPGREGGHFHSMQSSAEKGDNSETSL